MKNPISFFLCILTYGFLHGQEYYFKHYKVEDGLSHNTVICSLQDHKGFLWFGTKNGLNRFDGYNFKLFQNNPQDSTSLQGNYVECLHEYKNNIWVGTDNGLFRYNYRNENFEIVENTANLQIFDIENDSFDNLWYIAQNSLFKYNPDSKERTHYPIEDLFSPVDIIRTVDNEIWISSSTSLYHYVKETDSFIKYTLEVETDAKNPFQINALFGLDEQTILLGTANHGVIAFDIPKGKIKGMEPLTNSNYHVRDFALKGMEELWVASETGLHIYNLKTGSYTNLTKSYDDPYALSDNAVYCLTIDNEGGVWAGTYFGGISYRPKQYSPFKKFFPMSSHNSINGNAVREIKSDAFGNIWIGTEDAGLNKYDPRTNRFTNYTSKDRNGTLSHYNIHGLLPKDGKLWIGMFDSGLDVLDIKTDNIINHYNLTENDPSRSNFVFVLYQTRAKELIAASTTGVLMYNAKNDNFETLENFPSYLHYTCFLEDKEGILWAGTYSDGLYFYNPNTKEKGNFKYKGSKESGLAHNHINGIFQDSESNIWITTENGLNLLEPDKKELKKYGVRDGFPSNVFYAILEDRKGNLWISTANGLVEFDMKRNTLKTYTKMNGLLSDQFNYNSAYKDSEGRMYFGSVNGMVRFDPADFKKNTFSPPIFITGLQIQNQEVHVGRENSPIKESMTQLNHLVLSPNQSTFSLEFAALAYTNPQSTEYWYKMEGLSDRWVSLQKEHKVNFMQLPAGTYYFSVKSRNKSDVWGQETDRLKIEVLPVLWKSNVAYSVYAVLILTLALFGLALYHQRTRVRNDLKIRQLNIAKEKEVYESKIEFFTNISHEIRTPLTLIKSPLEKLLKTTDYPPQLLENLKIMEKNTSRLLDLANQLLDFRKTELENTSLTFVETNFSELVRQIYERFSQSIQEKGINFELAMDEDDIYAFVDAETMRKTLGNLFNNALKYSEKQIKTTLHKENGFLVFTIKNDGYLIPNYLKEKIFEPFYRVPNMGSQTGTGVGLSMASSFAGMHNGSLVLDTTDGTRNTFVLRLPLHQEREFTLHPPKNPKAIPSMEEIPPANPEIETGKIPILLIEDNEDLLNFISKDLRDTYTVLKAFNGKDALGIFEDKNIQLVISDVMMPGMDGFTLCRKIKTNVETSHIPIILLTAKNALHAKMEGLEAGADAYLEKPFAMEHLRAQITNLLENRKTIRAFYASSPLAHLKSIALTNTDESFLKKLDDVIVGNISDPDLNVDTLAEAMHVSRSSLYRKIKEISDLSPNELINLIRLKRSAELLKTKDYKIYEIAEMVGYNSQTSFGRNFQKQFNMTPTEYMNS